MKIQTWIYSNTVVFPAHWWRGVVFVKTFADDSLLRLWCSINTDSSIDIFLATPLQEASTTETTSHQWGGEQTIRRPQGHTWTLTTVFSHTHTHFSGCYAITTHMTSKNGSRLIFSQTIHIPHPDEVDLKTRQLWIRRISKTKSQIKIKPDETSTAFSYRRILQTTRLDLRTNTASRTTGIKNTPMKNEK